MLLMPSPNRDACFVGVSLPVPGALVPGLLPCVQATMLLENYFLPSYGVEHDGFNLHRFLQYFVSSRLSHFDALPSGLASVTMLLRIAFTV